MSCVSRVVKVLLAAFGLLVCGATHARSDFSHYIGASARCIHSLEMGAYFDYLSKAIGAPELSQKGDYLWRPASESIFGQKVVSVAIPGPNWARAGWRYVSIEFSVPPSQLKAAVEGMYRETYRGPKVGESSFDYQSSAGSVILSTKEGGSRLACFVRGGPFAYVPTEPYENKKPG